MIYFTSNATNIVRSDTLLALVNTPVHTFFSFLFFLLKKKNPKKKTETELTDSVLKKDPNTQEIKTTLFKWTKQTKGANVGVLMVISDAI